MDSFLDWFGLKRRQTPRIAVHGLVDVQVPETENFVGFYAQDVSLNGICLQGLTPDALERIRAPDREVFMRVRLPAPYGTAEFEAQLKWEGEEGGKILTGWTFTRISRAARRMIKDYIEAHLEDVVNGPSEAS